MLTRCLHKSQITPTRLMNGSYLRVRTICRFLIDSNIKDRNKSDVKRCRLWKMSPMFQRAVKYRKTFIFVIKMEIFNCLHK